MKRSDPCVKNLKNTKYFWRSQITEVKGYCDRKHYVGQKIEVSTTDSDGLCGTFFAASLPWITTFQYGGNIPFSLFAGMDKDSYPLHCPDVVNMVSARMTRTFHKVWDDAEVQRVIEEAMKEMNK
ncbi:MAG: TIGR04076 family protein [Deltaproteobacteria bacterium]|nr:TIGR04076 family protein [Deltaproteobacteria bacterium]